MNEEFLGLAQVCLYVSDIERSKQFYLKNLGFHLVHELNYHVTEAMNLPCGERDVTISYIDLGSFRMELFEVPNIVRQCDSIIDHICLKVNNLDEIVSRLKKNGIQFESEVPGTGNYPIGKTCKWILFRGPDGEHLELTEIFPKP